MATEEVLEDASFLEGEVSDLFGSEFAFKIQDLIIRGSGAGEPLGILNAGALVTQAKTSGQSADTISTANIVAMKARATGMAEFYANMDTMPQLDLLFKTAGDMDAKIFKSTGGGFIPKFFVKLICKQLLSQFVVVSLLSFTII